MEAIDNNGSIVYREISVYEDEITCLSSGLEVGNFRRTEIILNDTTFMVTGWTSMNSIGEGTVDMERIVLFLKTIRRKMYIWVFNIKEISYIISHAQGLYCFLLAL